MKSLRSLPKLPDYDSTGKPIVCYLFRSRTSNGVFGDHQWLRDELPKAQCPQCCRVKPSHWPKPLDQVVAERPRGIGSDHRGGGFLWKRLVIERLGPFVQECAIGRLFVRRADGSVKELFDWCTLYAKPGTEIFDSRGKLARHQACPICTYPLLRNGATAQRIVRRDVKSDRITMDASGTVYLHPAIKDAIDWTFSKDVYLGRVKLIEEPEDGQCLPGDPDWTPGGTRFAEKPPDGQPQYINDPDDLDPPVLTD